KGGLIAFVLVLLLALGAGLAGWYYGIGRYRSTPDVIAVSQSDATATMSASGLTLMVSGSAYSESIPEGYVVSTDPYAGDDVLRGGTVEAVVSKGRERHDVPDLAGMSESEAIAAITDNALEVATPERRWSETSAKGRVIGFSPPAGTELKRGADVTIQISKGPRPVRITDYTGEQAESADSELTDAGFKVVRVERYDDDVAEGSVLRQRPGNGIGHRDDQIRLVVSLGPHLVEVPNVDSFGVDDARDTLEKAGFKVEVDEFQPYFGLEYVVGQSPDAGSMVPYGSTLRIVVV
ncbi:MAG: PASTA domain-containing protein, partial [Propionibacteriales bacterium]|nr:PASTA domain-containing protein [Propionibacteriales bacterium]